MDRNSYNFNPLESWRSRPENDSHPARRSDLNRMPRLFPPYLPAGIVVVSPAYRQNPGGVQDQWSLFQERVARGPFDVTSFPGDQRMFLDNNATNSYPRQRSNISPIPEFPLNTRAAEPAEESRLSAKEQKEALNKLKKETYHPTMQKRAAKMPNLYYREYDIDKLRRTNQEKDEEDGRRCAICLEDFEPREVVTVTPCKHMFHEDCIVPWVKSQGRCPVCRFAICERLRGVAGSSNNATADVALESDFISVIRGMDQAYISDRREFVWP